jgi:glycosyltransferase involved in cell wall biosynthesis
VKVLHLYANWKWTGPAEPAVNLAAALRDRGLSVDFSCGRAVSGLENEIAGALAARDMETTGDFRLGKHRNPLLDPIDRRAMRRQLDRLKPDVLHCHIPNDHRIGYGAARGMKQRPKIVRTLYDGEIGKVNGDFRDLMGKGCDAVLAVSRTVARDLPGRLGIPEEKVFFVEAAVDLARFDTRRSRPAIAKEYGVRREDFTRPSPAWRRRSPTSGSSSWAAAPGWTRSP